MTWHMIRLDLARSPAHPDGSQEHCYLLRLPLDEGGLIDATALAADPERATVLRSRPDEADCKGFVGRGANGWVISYQPGEGEDEAFFRLESHPLRAGDYLTISDQAGEAQCFEVAFARVLAEP